MRRREEETLQINFVSWFRFSFPGLRNLLTLGSIGENVGPRRMSRLKRLGLTPGYPDLVLYYPTPKYPGLLIEMKTKTGKVRDNQSEIHRVLARQGYKVGLARSWEEARDIVKAYLYCSRST